MNPFIYDSSVEQLQESLALLKILALSNKSLTGGKYKPADKTFKDIGTKINEKHSA